MSITGLRSMHAEFTAKDKVIDLGELKKMISAAKKDGGGIDAAEMQYLSEARDTFEKKAKTHFDTKVAKKADKPLKLGEIRETQAGVSLDVTVKKDLTPPGGFDHKYQALAAAQQFDGMAAVVEDNKGKWHAYGTNMAKDTLQSNTREFGAVGNHKSMTLVNQWGKGDWETQVRSAYDLKKDLEAGKAGVTQAQVDDAFKDLIVRATGVDKSEIYISRGPKDRDPNKINFDYNHDSAGSVARYGKDGKTVKLASDKDTPIVPASLVMGPANLRTDSPVAFQRTLAHESTHLMHARKNEALVNEWRKDKKTDKDFQGWLYARKDKMTAEELETANQAANGSKSATEFAAHLKSFAQTFGSLNLKDATQVKEAKGYLADTGAWGAGVKLQKEMYEYLERAYLGWDDAHRAAFDKMVPDFKGSLAGFRK